MGNSDSWYSKQKQKAKQNHSLHCPASSFLRSPSPRDLSSLLTLRLLKDALCALSTLVPSWVPSPTCWVCGRTADPQAGVASLPPVPWGRAGASPTAIPTLLQLLPVCRWWTSQRSCCRYHAVLFRIFFSCLSQKPDQCLQGCLSIMAFGAGISRTLLPTLLACRPAYLRHGWPQHLSHVPWREEGEDGAGGARVPLKNFPAMHLTWWSSG